MGLQHRCIVAHPSSFHPLSGGPERQIQPAGAAFQPGQLYTAVTQLIAVLFEGSGEEGMSSTQGTMAEGWMAAAGHVRALLQARACVGAALCSLNNFQ